MLDNITKKNIDDCRDVLVGKVPDPKSQIEQITLALIYKFMDDMDKEAVEKFKGKAKFFSPPKYTGNKETDEKLIDYSAYSWRKLFDPSLSGGAMLALYSDALEKLQTNPNMPELFRNIFKNAYLPYRDPATLKLFLKYINEFTYSHSEKLGDAFEYLLSVMGSQGDAGQFRTPRHIIDFVTACVNPQKNEAILDPACGTAGFLLSAYKHILKQNTSPSAGTGAHKNNRPGSALKPDDRKKLANNLVGYDISPDMVRLSLANMYLHGFTTPQIHEYDTLSSEDRWQETYDVILANPPFMTPKGGIRPHKKFGVQANKAEVLFTDYIAEHLNSNGRAGIVVPNGIVATSQTAYKQLRKMLVQDSLLAVISLPAGVFQPYSGVKTSVLILDKRLAKKSKHILFLKIDNDGFDLGAQRREIEKNDLPLALQTLANYKESLAKNIAYNNLPGLATLVGKEIVLRNKEVVLSAERYFETIKSQTQFDLVKISEICEVIRGVTFGKNDQVESENDDTVKVATTKACQEFGIIDKDLYNIPKRFIKDEKKYLQEGDILISTANSLNLLGRATYVNQLRHKTSFGAFMTLVRPKNNRVLPLYLLHCLKTEQAKKYYEINANTTTNISNLTFESLNSFEIPLPPIEIQQQIVAEIEVYQKIIDGAKQVVNNYKPTITINPAWEMVELDEVCEKIQIGPFGTQLHKEDYIDSGIPIINPKHIKGSKILPQEMISYEKSISLPQYILKEGDIIMGRRGEMGRVAYIDAEQSGWFCGTGSLIIRLSENYNGKLYSIFFSNIETVNYLEKSSKGVTMANLNLDVIQRLPIPKISYSEQESILNSIEEEMNLVSANKRLIEIFEQKIKTKIGEVWGVKKDYATIDAEEKLLMAAEP